MDLFQVMRWYSTRKLQSMDINYFDLGDWIINYRQLLVNNFKSIFRLGYSEIPMK